MSLTLLKYNIGIRIELLKRFSSIRNKSKLLSILKNWYYTKLLMLNIPRAVNNFFFGINIILITLLTLVTRVDKIITTKVRRLREVALVTPMRKSGDKVAVMLAQIRSVSLLPFARHVAQVNVNCHFILLRRLIF